MRRISLCGGAPAFLGPFSVIFSPFFVRCLLLGLCCVFWQQSRCRIPLAVSASLPHARVPQGGIGRHTKDPQRPSKAMQLDIQVPISFSQERLDSASESLLLDGTPVALTGDVEAGISSPLTIVAGGGDQSDVRTNVHS